MHKLLSNKRIINILILTFILLNTIVIYYYNSKNIDLKIAYKGWGPQDYVNQKLFPENYEKNWDSGILAYDNSLVMHIFYLLLKYLKIDPEITIYPFIFIQIYLFNISIYLLSNTLFENVYISIIALSIIPICNIAGLNLSRFGYGFGTYLSLPLFYGYANAFRLLAINYFLQNKYSVFTLFIIISIYTHSTMGLFAFIFVLSYVPFNREILKNREFILSILIIIVSILIYLLFLYSNSLSSSEGITNHEWIKSTKLFCLHWYPLTMKLFTQYAHLEFLPTLLLCCIFTISLRDIDLSKVKYKVIIYGCGGCVLLSIIGIIVSELIIIPFFVKLSLQRSTALLTFFGIIFTINYLYSNIIKKNYLMFLVSIYFLIALILSSPGIAILPLMTFLYFDIKTSKLGPFVIAEKSRSKIFKIFILFFSIVIIVGISCTFKNQFTFLGIIYDTIWFPLKKLSFTSSYSILTLGGKIKLDNYLGGSCVIIATIAFLLVFKLYHKKYTIASLVILMALLTFNTYIIKKEEYNKWHNKYYEICTSYMETQLWASKNTSHNALFQIDPSHYYGWRDYSKRSSLGNLREWGFTSVAYQPNSKRYNAGKHLLKEMEIFLDDIYTEDIEKAGSIKYMKNLTNNIRDTYYGLTNEKRRLFLNEFNVDYFVMFKSRLDKARRIAIEKGFLNVYENQHFLIYKTQSSET